MTPTSIKAFKITIYNTKTHHKYNNTFPIIHTVRNNLTFQKFENIFHYISTFHILYILYFLYIYVFIYCSKLCFYEYVWGWGNPVSVVLYSINKQRSCDASRIISSLRWWAMGQAIICMQEVPRSTARRVLKADRYLVPKTRTKYTNYTEYIIKSFGGVLKMFVNVVFFERYLCLVCLVLFFFSF